MDLAKITVVLINKNSEQKLKPCLESLKDFKEVILYDNGSSDKSLEIAKKYKNIKIYEGEFLGFGASKKKASNFATNDWIFSLDTDECISTKLKEELKALNLEDKAVYSLRRDNYYKNRLIKTCGWYGERVLRLYNKKITNFNDNKVHEHIISKGLKKIKLNEPINHYSFRKIADFLDKIQIYSEIYAKEHKNKKNISIFNALFRGFYSFFKSYILKKGITEGFDGFIISFFNGLGTTVKYLKLKEYKNESISKKRS